MGQRRGSTGPNDPIRDVVVAVPNITDGDLADVVLTADAVWKTESALQLMLVGAPLANLVPVAAWVSTPSTGAVTVRFGALLGNVTAGNQAVRIIGVPSNAL
jgi:hypothetical protein